MGQIKNHQLFKTICIALIATFVGLDISYAYPPQHTAQNSTLATPSLLQQQPVNEQVAQLRQSVFSSGELIGSICSIADYLLQDRLPLKYLEQVLTAELGQAIKGIDLSRVSVKDGVVLVPCEIEGKKQIIQIALKNSSAADGLKGRDLDISDKYVIKEASERNPKFLSALADLPNHGIGSQIALEFNPEEYDIAVMAQDRMEGVEGDNGPYSGRFLFDAAARCVLKDGTPIPTGEDVIAKGRRNITSYIEEYQNSHPDREVIAVFPHGNGMYNEGFVMFVNGKLYHPWNEPFNTPGHSYSCAVIWTDGHMSVKELEFSEKEVFVAGTDRQKKITNEIISAIAGQQIVKNGKPVPIETLYAKFTDLKQIFMYPGFKEKSSGGTFFFGVKQMYAGKKIDEKLFAAACHGEHLVFSKQELIDNDITDGAFKAEMARLNELTGKLNYVEGKDYEIGETSIRIQLKLNPYAHNLIGVKKDDRTIIAIICPGSSKEHKGITIKELQDFAIEKGVKDIVLLSNGGDVQIVDAKGNKVVASQGARSYFQSVVLVAKKKLSKITETEKPIEPVQQVLIGSGQGGEVLVPETRRYIEANVKKALNFLAASDTLPDNPDLLMILGSRNSRIPIEAARLYASMSVKPRKVLFTGGNSPVIEELRKKTGLPGTEAEIFRELFVQELLRLGYSQSKIDTICILMENQATNTGENMKFSIELLEKEGRIPKNVILMQTPQIQRRAKATFEKWFGEKWPNENIRCASYTYMPDVAAMTDEDLKAMAGKVITEVKNLEEYGPAGKKYIVKVDIPVGVIDAVEGLKILLIDDIVASVTQELMERQEVSAHDLFVLVQSKIPASMQNLRNALAELEPLSGQKDLEAKTISQAIAATKVKHNFSNDEARILWLALTGPGQGGGEEKRSTSKIIPLGQDAPVESIGNKARSFVIFQSLGLRFPQGVVIPSQAVCSPAYDHKEIIKSVEQKLKVQTSTMSTTTYRGSDYFIDIPSLDEDYPDLEEKLRQLMIEYGELSNELSRATKCVAEWPGPDFDAGAYHKHGEMLGNVHYIVDPDVSNRVTPLLQQIRERIDSIKQKMAGKENRVSLAVRSSPVISMPGALGTELHIDDESRLSSAIHYVRNSWNSGRAKEFRENNNISDKTGMAIIVQRMPRGPTVASGVAFSRNPDTGENGLFGNIEPAGGGWMIVSGESKKAMAISELSKLTPRQYDELKVALAKLEQQCGYPQEVEFTIVDDTLYFLQTRNISFTPKGELRYLKDAVKEGFASEMSVLPKLDKLQQKVAKRKVFRIREGVKKKIVGRGMSSMPGAMAGRLVFGVKAARKYSNDDPVIIVSCGITGYESIPSGNTREEIVSGVSSFPKVGLITFYGNASSHEAVLTRLAGIPTIINAQDADWSLADRELRFKEDRIKEGDFIVIDGDNNEVFLTNDRDVLAEDESILDASFGIDINNYRRKFTKPYLTDDGSSIKTEISYQQLLDENVKAWQEYKKLAVGEDKKSAFMANLRKHFLHELFIQKAIEIGKTQEDASRELAYRISDDANLAVGREKESADKKGTTSENQQMQFMAQSSRVPERFRNCLKKEGVFSKEEIDILMSLKTPNGQYRCTQFANYNDLIATLEDVNIYWSHMRENHISRVISIFGVEKVLNCFWDDPYKFLYNIINLYESEQDTRHLSDGKMREKYADFIEGNAPVLNKKAYPKAEPRMDASIKVHIDEYIARAEDLLSNVDGSTALSLSEAALEFIKRYRGIILPRNISIGSFLLRMLYEKPAQDGSPKGKVLATDGKVYEIGDRSSDYYASRNFVGGGYISEFFGTHNGGEWHDEGKVAEYFYDPQDKNRKNLTPPSVEELFNTTPPKDNNATKSAATMPEIDLIQNGGKVMATDGTIYEIGGTKSPHDPTRSYVVHDGHIFKWTDTHYGGDEYEVGTVKIYHYEEPGEIRRIFNPQQKDGTKQEYGTVLGTDGKVYHLRAGGPYTKGCMVRNGIIYETPGAMATGVPDIEIGRVKIYYYDEYENPPGSAGLPKVQTVRQPQAIEEVPFSQQTGRVLATNGNIYTLGGTPEDRTYVSNGKIVNFVDNHEGGNTYTLGDFQEYLGNDDKDRTKNLSRGQIDEISETHPALEVAANNGRMFAVTLNQLDRLDQINNEAFTDLLLANLIHLRSPPETRNKLLQKLQDPIFRKTVIKGFTLMGESIKAQPLSNDKPIRLCIIVEDEDLPTIVFKDAYNNLIAHSGKGEKTSSPYTSIYAGYNLLTTSLATNREVAFREIISHEARDIIKGHHDDDASVAVSKLYDDVVDSTKIEVPRNSINDFIKEPIEKYGLKEISFVFDIDGTLNKERNVPISDEIAVRLADILAKGASIQIITGKSKEELEEGGIFNPLFNILQQRNTLGLITGMVIYTSDGAGKYVFDKNCKLNIDEEYGNPFTSEEAKVMENVIHEISDELEKAHNLSKEGVVPFVRNFSNLKFNFSPYGNRKIDALQYAFEKDKEIASRYLPSRKTRKEIADDLIKRLKNRGISNIEYIISGSTTIGLVRQGVDKTKACKDILKSKKFVFYVGDETGQGNDALITKLAKERNDLVVVSVDKEKPSNLHEKVIWIGKNIVGTESLLDQILVLLQDGTAGITAATKTSDLKEVLNMPDGNFEIPIGSLMKQYESNISWAIKRLKTSTAGTRGKLNKDDIFGGKELNAAVVMFMAQAYAEYINKHFPPDQRSAFVGFDPRYFSREFAQIFTRVLLANGIRVYRDKNEQPTSTPVTSYMAYYFNLACGIEITSSHNPPEQNGIKSSTYYGGVDTDNVSAMIAEEMNILNEMGRRGQGLIKAAPYDNSKITFIDAKEIYYENYLQRIFTTENIERMKRAMDSGARFIFDGLYGVGGPSIEYYLDKIFNNYQWRDKIIVMNATPDSSIGGINRPDPSRPETLELSGVLEKLAATKGVLIAVTADMDADRIGTAVIIPAKDVAKAKKYGLFVSEMKFGNEIVNIVRFTPNQIFTLVAYERALLATERAHREGLIPNLYLMTSIPSSIIAKTMIEKFGGKAVLTTVGFKNLGDQAYQLDKKDKNTTIVALMEESGGANIGPLYNRDKKGSSIHRDKDTITLALVLYDSASRLSLESKNMVDLYVEMADKLGGLFYYERLDAYLPDQNTAESPDPDIQKAANAIKENIIAKFRAIDHVKEKGAVKSNLDKPGNIAKLAEIFAKSSNDIIDIEEVPVPNTVLLVGEGNNWNYITPVAKRFKFKDGEVIEVFHTGREDQEGPSITIYDKNGRLKARTLMRPSGTESMVRVYMEIFEPQENPHPENLYKYFEGLLRYLGLHEYSLKHGGTDYLTDFVISVNSKYGSTSKSSIGKDNLGSVTLPKTQQPTDSAESHSSDRSSTDATVAATVTNLSEMVESSVNNHRVEFIEAGNKFINSLPAKENSESAANTGVLDKNIATAEIRQRVERAIAAIEKIDKKDIAPEVKTTLELLKKNLNQFEADGAVGSLIVLARKAKRENQKLIIGLETDWIPGLNEKGSLQRNAIAALMKEIDAIGEALKSMGLDNVEVIRGNGEKLASALLSEADKTHTSLNNIVVMASTNTINSNSFKALKNADENDRPFLAAIDPTELIKFYEQFGETTSKQLYIRLTGLLYMTLELAAGKEPPQLPIIVSYDKKMRIVIFLPKAEPLDYEVLKNNYAAEKTALSAA